MTKYILLLVILLFMSSLYANPWLGKDKTMHFVSSAYLTYWNYSLSSNVMNNSNDTSLLFAVSLTSLAGIGKEASDKYIKKTKWSWYDIAYNSAGIAFGIIMIKNIK